MDTGCNRQTRITDAVRAALLDTSIRCRCRCRLRIASGFIELTAQQILAVVTEMRFHVQACFDREAELLAHLEAGTYDDSMLDQGWPA